MKKGSPEAKVFGQRLREARKRQGLSMQAFAEMSGLNFATLSQYENAHRVPSLSALSTMCGILGEDPTQLLFGRPTLTGNLPEGIDLLRDVLISSATDLRSAIKQAERVHAALTGVVMQLAQVPEESDADDTVTGD